jgi:hypothetical protein
MTSEFRTKAEAAFRDWYVNSNGEHPNMTDCRTIDVCGAYVEGCEDGYALASKVAESRLSEATKILKTTLQVNELDGFIGLAVKKRIEDFLKSLEATE